MMDSRIYRNRDGNLTVLRQDGRREVIPAASDGMTDDTAPWQAAINSGLEKPRG